MLGIILYGFCRGIFSSRKLERACQQDIGFMYVSGQNTPDHTVICRFIQRWDKAMKDIFQKVVYLAHNKGFIDYRCLALDGTKIRANVSRSYTGTLKDFRKRVDAIDHSINKALERLTCIETDEEPPVQKRLERMQKERDRIKSFLNTAQEQHSVTGKEKKQSITDPDSRVMVMPDGTCQEAYNAQACVDHKSGMIVGQMVVQAENDRHLLTPVLDTVVHPEEHNMQGAKVLADAGYWEPGQLTLAENRGFETYVPDQKHANPFVKVSQEEQEPSISLVEDPAHEARAICSGGKVLTATSRIQECRDRNKGGPYRVFPVTSDETCKLCLHHETCFPNGRTKKTFTMSVNKIDHQGTIRRVEERMTSKAGLQVFRLRMQLIERTFAEIKSTMGFRRFLRRGMSGVAREWTILCMAFNMRRMFVQMHQG
jgi:hypothetical protein